MNCCLIYVCVVRRKQVFGVDVSVSRAHLCSSAGLRRTPAHHNHRFNRDQRGTEGKFWTWSVNLFFCKWFLLRYSFEKCSRIQICVVQFVFPYATRRWAGTTAGSSAEIEEQIWSSSTLRRSRWDCVRDC